MVVQSEPLRDFGRDLDGEAGVDRLVDRRGEAGLGLGFNEGSHGAGCYQTGFARVFPGYRTQTRKPGSQDVE